MYFASCLPSSLVCKGYMWKEDQELFGEAQNLEERGVESSVGYHFSLDSTRETEPVKDVYIFCNWLHRICLSSSELWRGRFKIGTQCQERQPGALMKELKPPSTDAISSRMPQLYPTAIGLIESGPS